MDSEFGVRAFRSKPDDPLREAAFADPDGLFSLPGCPAGRIAIQATAPGFVDSAPRGVDVAPAGTSQEIVLALKEPGAIAGRVLSASDGEPVSGAVVRLGRIEFDAAESGQRESDEGECSTLPDGTFSLDCVPPGKWDLSVASPDLAIGFADGVVVEPGSTSGPVTIRLAAGGGVRGTVFGRDGLPEALATVAIYAGNLDVKRRTRTDEAGGYEMRGIRPGTYRILKLPPRAPNSLANARTLSVRILEGEMMALDIREESVVTRVTGTVTDEGAPVEGAVVVAAIETDRVNPGDEGPRPFPVMAALTDASGTYALPNLSTGRYAFHVLRNRGARPFVVRAAVPKERDVAIDFTVPVGGFAGRVVDERTQEAIPGITMKATRSGPPRGGSAAAGRVLATTVTGLDGSYLFERLPAGSYGAEAGDDPPKPRQGEREARSRRRPYAKEKWSGGAITVEEESLTTHVDFALRRP
jgi:hypothetical protein